MFSIDKDKNITMTRGDTLRVPFSVKSADGSPYSFDAGDVLHFYLGRSATADPNPVISKTLSTSAPEIYLTSDETKALKADAYVYDIELTKANGDVMTVINAARLIFRPEVG